MATTKRVVVVAGVGNGLGTGAATARLFVKEGYAVALLSRRGDSLSKFAEDLKQAGGEAVAFPLASYSAEDIKSAWASIRVRFPTPNYNIRVALWNAVHGIFKGFLEVTQEEFEQSFNVVNGAFAFSKEAILSFKGNEIEAENNKRGALFFTGATASLRGGAMTSSFAPPKFALRALSQSLNKEFGKDNIHVAHAVIDGHILTDRVLHLHSKEWAEDPNARLDPMSIAHSYLYLTRQDNSAWTWELDLRPAHEKW